MAVREIVPSAKTLCGDYRNTRRASFANFTDQPEQPRCADWATHVVTESSWGVEYYLCTVHAIQFALTGDWYEQ